MKIKNWKKFQHFKDRRPPWIKLYHTLLDDVDWYALSDAEARTLTLCWLVASEYGGELPKIADLAWRLRKGEDEIRTHLEVLLKAGWIIESGSAEQKITAKDVAITYGYAQSRYVSNTIKIEVFKRDGGACVQCRRTESLEYDHVIPVSRGGESTIDNLQLLCRRCNRSKRASLRQAEQVATQSAVDDCALRSDPLHRVCDSRSLETETETYKPETYKPETEKTIVQKPKAVFEPTVIDGTKNLLLDQSEESRSANSATTTNDGEPVLFDLGDEKSAGKQESVNGRGKLKKTKKAKKADAYDQTILAIYEVYPKKVGRGVALKSIQSAINRGHTADVILEATKAYAASPIVRTTEMQFIPHPSTWFNQDRFLDDRATWNQSRSNGATGEESIEDAVDRVCREVVAKRKRADLEGKVLPQEGPASW